MKYILLFLLIVTSLYAQKLEKFYNEDDMMKQLIYYASKNKIVAVVKVDNFETYYLVVSKEDNE